MWVLKGILLVVVNQAKNKIIYIKPILMNATGTKVSDISLHWNVPTYTGKMFKSQGH